MVKYLESAYKGISNLKETYATCSQTCARIDVVLKKIEDCISHENCHHVSTAHENLHINANDEQNKSNKKNNIKNKNS